MREERCMGNVRWNADHKLQQLWEIIEYKDGRPFERREEWRDVPQAS